jgi:hypothetical protein
MKIVLGLAYDVHHAALLGPESCAKIAAALESLDAADRARSLNDSAARYAARASLMRVAVAMLVEQLKAEAIVVE